jgi:uncharacterized protein YbjT (DUF2867 family)
VGGGNRPIAVLGASGNNGRADTAPLLRRGVAVRAVVRRPGRLGPVAAASGGAAAVTEVVADLDTGEGLGGAFAGCAAAYLLAPNVHPDEPGVVGHALQAATEAGLERVVLHSVLHPHDSAMPHHLAKARSEELVRGSGLPWAVLQPCAYTQNLTAALPQALGAGRLEVPYRVDAPFTLVDLDDVGEAAAVVLTEDGHDGASYELCGPDVVTVRDVATLAGRLADRHVDAVRTDPDTWLSGAGAALPQYPRAALHAMFRAYDAQGLVGGRRVLPWLLGRPSTPPATSIERAVEGRA